MRDELSIPLIITPDSDQYQQDRQDEQQQAQRQQFSFSSRNSPVSPISPVRPRPYVKMQDYRPPRRSGRVTTVLIISYVTDWVVLIVFGLVSLFVGNLKPNMRPFNLEDPDISFPYDTHETISRLTLGLCAVVAPIVLVALASLALVPGSMVPPGTPRSLVWRRKLWELHAGWLGLAVSLIGAYFVTNGLKNLAGKPRPDMLSRCQPDLANLARYVVGGGIANSSSDGQLVSGDICKQPDTSLLNDGFRSFPSGHSSSSAAGLVYLSLFLASKLVVSFPFANSSDPAPVSAFPSRLPRASPSLQSAGRATDAYEMSEYRTRTRGQDETDPPKRTFRHQDDAGHGPGPHHRSATVSAVRRQAAAPPLYLVALCLIPTGTAIFIATTRWFNFRHHGFDIISGFLIGAVSAACAFRLYHPAGRQGSGAGGGAGGWAWGPRSHDRAFWAGVGSPGYAGDKGGDRWLIDNGNASDEEMGGGGGGGGAAPLMDFGSRDGRRGDRMMAGGAGAGAGAGALAASSYRVSEEETQRDLRGGDGAASQ